MSRERLFEIKDQIKTAKTEKDETKGQISSIEERMEKKFKVKTISAAGKELKKKERALDKMEETYNIDFTKLEEAHEWD